MKAFRLIVPAEDIFNLYPIALSIQELCNESDDDSTTLKDLIAKKGESTKLVKEQVNGLFDEGYLEEILDSNDILVNLFEDTTVKTAIPYLKDLKERIRDIPVNHGVDGGDCDAINLIVEMLEKKKIKK